MELTTISPRRVLTQELFENINIDSLLTAANNPEEDLLNFLATFTAENGAELKFEFHASDISEARDHIESMSKYFNKNIHFLGISGDKWNKEPDRLKGVILKRKREMAFLEFEFFESSFFSMKQDCVEG